jgi:hypothetical protein
MMDDELTTQQLQEALNVLAIINARMQRSLSERDWRFNELLGQLQEVDEILRSTYRPEGERITDALAVLGREGSHFSYGRLK